MSPNSPQPDPNRTGVDLHSIVQVARGLRSEDGENAEYDRALVELIANSTPTPEALDYDGKRAMIEHLVLGEQRQFEIRGRIVIDYAMGFSEAEARDWFPDAGWNNTNTSPAGTIETEYLDSAPKDFWLCVQTKRDVVVDMQAKVDVETQGNWKIRDEVTGVVEL